MELQTWLVDGNPQPLRRVAEGIVALGELGNLIDELANLARRCPARVGVRAVNFRDDDVGRWRSRRRLDNFYAIS